MLISKNLFLKYLKIIIAKPRDCLFSLLMNSIISSELYCWILDSERSYVLVLN